MFKCDAHVHTFESSICGKIPAKELVKIYSEKGYSTIFITDHIDWRRFDENKVSFKKYVENSLVGYEVAKTEGDKIGLIVLWATEIMLRESFNHYLVYGIKPCDIYEKEDLFDLSTLEFYNYMKSKGGFIVQAHPYRDEECFPTKDYLDAFEVYNSHPRHRNHNDDAKSYATEHKLIVTAGSDTHQIPDVGLSGIITKTKIESASDYINAVKTKNLKIIY